MHGAIALGAPYDMFTCAEHMQHDWLHDRWYNQSLAAGLVQLFSENAHLFKNDTRIDHDAVMACQSMRSFDELVTRRLFGYHTVNEYHRLGSCVLRLPLVRVPLICMSARDDPICPPQQIPHAEVVCNPYSMLVETSHGGHLGWYEGTRKID